MRIPITLLGRMERVEERDRERGLDEDMEKVRERDIERENAEKGGKRRNEAGNREKKQECYLYITQPGTKKHSHPELAGHAVMQVNGT